MVKNYAKKSNIPICPGLTKFSIYFNLPYILFLYIII